MARFRISPSRLARFYFHECERYLRYSTATKEQRELDGIPPIELDRTLVTKAILESGYAWERRVLDEHLRERAIVAEAPDQVDVTDRRHSAEATLELLQHARAGDAIYQPTLRAPASFYPAYGLDPDVVELVDCHPDLLMVEETDDGLQVVVVDAKATAEMALSHRIQTTLYTLLLRHVLAEAGHDEGLTTSREGGVWLYGRDDPERFELARIACEEDARSCSLVDESAGRECTHAPELPHSHGGLHRYLHLDPEGSELAAIPPQSEVASMIRVRRSTILRPRRRNPSSCIMSSSSSTSVRSSVSLLIQRQSANSSASE